MTTTFPTTVDTATQLYTAVNGIATTLNGSIDNSVTTITVVDTTNFPSVGYVVIETEIIKYTGKTGTTFTGCTRGADSSTAASHATALAVNAYIVADHHNALMGAIIAAEQYLSDRFGLQTTYKGLINSGASPSSMQLKLAANSLGALGFLCFAADSQNIYFDLDWISGALLARSATVAGISKTASLLSIGANSGQSVGSAGTLLAALNIDLATRSVLKPLQPSFLATRSAPVVDVTGDGTSYTVICDTEVFDQGANYNPSTGVFTAPITGRYQLNAVIQFIGILVNATTRSLTIVTSNRSYFCGESELLAQDFLNLAMSVLADMDTNDTATMVIRVASSTKVVDLGGSSNETSFSGSLIN